jgi:hypothetical protein
MRELGKLFERGTLMTLKWIEGFEIGRMQTEMQDKYAVYSGPANTGYTGRVVGNAGRPIYLTTPSLGSNDTWIIGFGFKRASSATHYYFDLYSGANRQFTIQFHATDPGNYWTVRLLRGATEVEAGTSELAYDVWYYIELKVTIDPSAGAYELRINEITEMSDTSVNTAESGSGNADVFHVRNSFSQYLDDLYICDDNGSNNNDFLGDCQVEGILPNGAGDRTEWSANPASNNYQRVDDPQNAYSLTDYVYDDTNGQGDLYEFEDPGAISGEIKGIAVITFAALSAAGSRVIRNLFKTDGGGTEYDLDSMTVASTDAAGFLKIQETNPDTSLAWTDSELSDAQFGVEVVS